MKKPIFAFSADTHLDINNWAKKPELRGDSMASFSQLIDFCIDRKIPLILGGDIFDKQNPGPEVVQFFIKEANRLKDSANQTVYFVQGDHDKRTVPWCLLSPSTEWLDHKKVKIGKFKFYGLDFYPRSQIGEHLEDIPKDTDFLVTHLAWSDIQNIGATNADISMILAECDILAGDWHTHKIYESTNGAGKKIKAYSPGSTNMRALNESADKFFYLFYDDKSSDSVKLDTRRCYTWTISNEQDLEGYLSISLKDVFDNIKTANIHLPDIQKPIIRIKYDETLPRIYERIMKSVKGHAHLFLEPFSNSEVINIDVKEILKKETSFVDVVKEFSSSNKVMQDAAVRLLSTNELNEEFDRLFTEYKNAN